MPFTEAARIHLTALAERGVPAEKQADKTVRKAKTTTKRKPRVKKPAVKKAE